MNMAVDNFCYFWIAEYNSVEAEIVKSNYGVTGAASINVLVLAPSYRSIPQCVEILAGCDIVEENLRDSILLAKELSAALKEEGTKLEAWRQEQREPRKQDGNSNRLDSRGISPDSDDEVTFGPQLAGGMDDSSNTIEDLVETDETEMKQKKKRKKNKKKNKKKTRVEPEDKRACLDYDL
ncbi:uncharacterized protein LOC114948683 [Acropora millepora]|uniref:uncharacterized protein LOC114948683 n=1 Tax=Acropora millepora TaxID=45264 RepID=UPI001CF5D8AB|nr:uncharacterized protein LOC114948683 [Acropora millepora]